MYCQALEHQLEQVKAELEHVRCPVHGESPSIVVTGQSADSISANAEGCCDVLGELARARLAEMGFDKEA